MKAAIVLFPFLTAALAAYLYGWTMAPVETIGAYCLAFAFVYLLALQGITMAFCGEMTRPGFYHAGAGAFLTGLVLTVGLLIGYATGDQARMWMTLTSPKAPQFLLANALWGCPGVALLLWPPLTLFWIARVWHWSQVETDMQAKQSAWNSRNTQPAMMNTKGTEI